METIPDIRKQKAEEIRLRALYRRLAMRGGRSFSRLPLSALKGLVGPDCAYHLYGSVPSLSGDKHED